MRNIGVFIGSNDGVKSQYAGNAVLLAEQIAQRRFGLVYGGANVGLMGRLADAAIKSGGRVTGVIPECLLSQEIGHSGLNKLHVVKSMQQRKAMMIDLADAFIAFPGGIGMLEETFEVWSAIKLGLYNKPLGLFNVEGYFDPLLNFLNHSIEEGFVKQEQLDRLIVSACPTSLLDRMGAIFDGGESICQAGPTDVVDES